MKASFEKGQLIYQPENFYDAFQLGKIVEKLTITPVISYSASSNEPAVTSVKIDAINLLKHLEEYD